MIYYVGFQLFSKVIQLYIYMYLGFPLGTVVKESPCNEEDLVSIPGFRRYAQRDMTSLSSILAWRIPMDRGAWWTTVHGVGKSWTQLSN